MPGKSHIWSEYAGDTHVIGSSLWATSIVDITIVGMLVVMLTIGVARGMFAKGYLPRTGRFLIVTGLMITGLFYALELLSIWVFPVLIGEAQSLVIGEYLAHEVRAFVSLLSLVVITSGVLVTAVHRKQVESEIDRSRAQVALAQSSIVQSESRYRSLISTTPDSVYCFEFDPPMPLSTSFEDQVAHSYEAILVECNTSFAEELEVNTPGQVLGMKFGEMDSTKDRRSHAELIRAFIDSNYQLQKYELLYKDRQGSDRALQLSWNGVIENNHLLRIWGAETNILDLRKTKAELRSRQQFESLLARISTRLLTTQDDVIEETIQRFLKTVSEYIGADRASLIWIDKKEMSAQLLYYWNEHGGPPWVEISLDTYPWLAPQVLDGKTVVIDDPEELPAVAAVDRRSLSSLGLKSLIALPLSVANKLVGAITFGDINRNRVWTAQDQMELTVLAELFANVISRINSRKALDSALANLRRATDRLEAENVYLREEIKTNHDFDEIIGESPQLVRCLRHVGQVATTNTPVLILGETGTGKELIARAIHEHSERHQRALVKVNCAALPANLVESELFGHEKGAFTGAATRKRGRFDLADGGTLFLDEIGDFPLALQGKLLRVLQEGEFERLGGNETIDVDVRLIAATNRKLIDAVGRGEFRADLFYRINTFPIELPPLRERVGDVQLLAEHFVEVHAGRLKQDPPVMSSEMIEQLNAYSWPGNIRELESVIQRSIISATGPMLQLDEPLSRTLTAGVSKATLKSRSATVLSDVEAEHIREVLEESSWTISGTSGAASRLGIPPSTLRSKMKKLGIERPA